MKRKSQISIQFNWIFVLIVGALILVFFANIIRTQQRISQNKVSATVLNDIDAISSGAEVSRGTVQIINIPNLDLGFRCGETCDCAYSLSQIQERFGDKVMFAPDLIQGRRITAWTYDWSMPYRVSNLLFMTSPDVRYIILDDLGSQQMAEELDDVLPPKSMIIDGNEEIIFNKEIVDPRDINDIQNLNNYKVKIIGFARSSDDPLNCVGQSFFNIHCKVPPALQDLGDNFVTGIQIIDGTKEFGRFNFVKKNGDEWVTLRADVPYLGESMLYAAIFAEDFTMYRCGVEKLFEKMSYVNKVYTNRTRLLRADAILANDPLNVCPAKYNQIIAILDSPASGISSIINDVLFNGISEAKLRSLQSKAFIGSDALEEQNIKLQQTSCQEIF
jgi:hypothetical protein